jgi:hypothetical protein
MDYNGEELPDIWWCIDMADGATTYRVSDRVAPTILRALEHGFPRIKVIDIANAELHLVTKYIMSLYRSTPEDRHYSRIWHKALEKEHAEDVGFE